VTIHREGGLRNYFWSVRATNSTRAQFAKCAKRSALSGPIFLDRRAATKIASLVS
jgi:hypothetical protein